MKLSISPRKVGKKSDVKQLRRKGTVPGVLYGVKTPNQPISFPLEELKLVFRSIRPNLLPTTVFTLQEGDRVVKALVKEIQYHKTSYDVLHVDFALVTDQDPVVVHVPIQVSGLADCAGIKLGGFMRQIIRSLKVSSLVKDIPQELLLDVRELNVGDSKTLADLVIPAGVKPLAKMNEVAVVIAKKV